MTLRVRTKVSSYLIMTLALFSARLVLGSNLPVGAGYSLPSSVIRVAPGQVITIFTKGIQTRLPQAVLASRLPLPISLNGISLTVKQMANPQSIPVPMFGIFQFDACQSLAAEPCTTTAITIQIPFELVPGIPGAAPAVENIATLVVTENGTSGEPLVLVPIQNQIHVVDLCDAPSPAPSSIPCPASVVTHADGNLVTLSNPARGGEILVLYAFGLGRTTPLVSSGNATPIPAPTGIGLLGFEFGVNAASRSPVSGQSEQPIFVGLTPGFVSLYQVNFRVPPIPPGISSCGGPILSNLTVTLVGSTSSDGARICVFPNF
jgi:uncharacterized protein (TIGR03437 family)